MPSASDEHFLFHERAVPGGPACGAVAAVRRRVLAAAASILGGGGGGGLMTFKDRRRGIFLFVATVACLAFFGALATTLVGDDGDGEAGTLYLPDGSVAVRTTGSRWDSKGRRQTTDENGVLIEEDTLEVMGTHMFLRRATPPVVRENCPPVLLLHGAAFSSKLWQNFGTLSLLGHKAGCLSYAVDLPTGNAEAGRLTENANVAPAFRGDFLAALVKHLSPDRPMIIVAPSMSGSYAIPLVINRPELVAGFVPVAPVLEMSPDDKERLKASLVPTLAICGEWDLRGRRVTETLLAAMPRATTHVLPEARHAAYVDQPDKFHELLLEFVLKVSRDAAAAGAGAAVENQR